MTARETRFLFAGTVLGGVLAAGAFLALWRDSTTPAPAEPAPTGSMSAHGAHAAETAATANAPAAKNEKPAPGPVGMLELTPEELASIGVETVEVRRRILEQAVTAVGRIEEAETRLATISARVGGRIDKLHLDFTGESVRRGQPIAEIYSPEVVSSAEEYRLALENLERMGAAAPQAVEQARELVAASRRRLELWGLTPEQIRSIEKSEQPSLHITLHAPVSGIVTERRVTEGQYVREGDVLYTLSDLSTVWVKADVYEADMPRVRPGQAAEITSEALPGETLRGRVGFVEPMVNPQTRTVAVRIEVRNPALRLRPGMYVMAMLRGAAARSVLAVPRSAVLDTGMRKVAYVAKGEGVFEGRQLELGPAAGDYFPVLAGLNEGERVVARGGFLIDSQTRLAGGLSGMFGGSKEFQPPAKGEAKAWKITFQVDPSPPRGSQENTVRVQVLDAAGKPATDASVRVEFWMPAMPEMGMGEMRAGADLKWDGSAYSGSIRLPSAGSWNVTVQARRGTERLAAYRTRVDAI
ncbi:MAG TPA: efflux RND transporter periplasmic adaptor subunit [Terriglobales bacterium]|nr:efflux RND transporter periplasmic adaptor subunit [Terriglobales bacterium]